MAALVLAAETVRGADLLLVDATTSPLWIGAISAGANWISPAEGQKPSEFSGTVTSDGFSAYVSASVSSIPGAITLDISGALSSGAGVPIVISLGDPLEVNLHLPESPGGVVQIVIDWELSASQGWTLQAGYGNGCTAEVVGLGFLLATSTSIWARASSPQNQSPDPYEPSLGLIEAPSGSVVRLRCLPEYIQAISTDGISGPFSALAKLRFRVARPLPPGDANSDGVADLVDVVVLRRQLVGLPVQ